MVGEAERKRIGLGGVMVTGKQIVIARSNAASVVRRNPYLVMAHVDFQDTELTGEMHDPKRLDVPARLSG